MIDHIGIGVSNLQLSKAFYVAAFAPINYQLLMEFPAAVTGTVDVAGFGEAPKPDFWISETSGPISPVHVAIAVASREKVDAFYSAALDAGGRDNGAPGLRPHYHANYYGAFILDPDGHNIEAVCHHPA
jgi:catechol 2,3-dioxygenase-like lactoylglutathione lyase family enzyme